MFVVILCTRAYDVCTLETNTRPTRWRQQNDHLVCNREWFVMYTRRLSCNGRSEEVYGRSTLAVAITHSLSLIVHKEIFV